MNRVVMVVGLAVLTALVIFFSIPSGDNIEVSFAVDQGNTTTSTCPAHVFFKGEIKSSSEQIQYRFTRSDGAISLTYNLTGPGPHKIETWWKLGSKNPGPEESFWVRVEILKPRPINSEKAFFQTHCSF